MFFVAPSSTLVAFDLEPFSPGSIKRWSKEIATLEAKDQTETHPDNSILFVGSSSIRLWNSIAQDMAPYHPIQRGFGGARWTDVAIFADRLITPHKFRAVVFFVANDITGGSNHGLGDRTPQEVVELFAQVHSRVRAHNPTAPIFYIAVTPTAKRFDVWPQINNGNKLISEFCQKSTDTYFIGTESIYLDAQGQPRLELFVPDRLHLNPAGYKLWSAAIKSQLDSVLGGAK